MKLDQGYFTICTPFLNQGLAYSNNERDKLGLRGLLPTAVIAADVQLERAMTQLRSKSSPIEKYIFMQTMQDTNEKLYYRLLVNYTSELMPIVYTPTVGEACVEFSHIYRQTPRGLYLSLNDLGKVRSILDNWPHKHIKAIVFTDGERILGLGDLGINGMGIPIGKLALYTACAGVNPEQCLPVILDVGTDNKAFLEDKFYMGLRQPRERSDRYDALVSEFMNAAKDKYGREVLLQFEDFGNSNAFRLLHLYRHDFCCFNDDIQGTASVVVAGLLASVPVTGLSISKQRFVFLGAGEAGTGIADLVALAIHKESGKPISEARKQIFLVDSKGLVVASRKNSLQHHKLPYAHNSELHGGLLETVKAIRPTVLIGVCTIPNTFTKEICEEMAKINDRPIIFALSNPTSKAECTAADCYAWTNGKAIFASGSPFDPVILNGTRHVPGQGNNAYVFPGVALGVIAAGITTIPDEMMLVAAKALSDQVGKEELDTGCVYPPLKKIREVSLNIAVAIAEYGYAHGLAQVNKPGNILAHCRSLMYQP